jgi:EmrB/QacA subfamily drug resistance transporter
MSPMNEISPAATDRNKWIALVVLCAGFLMIVLDQTIVNVALPSIQTDLHFSQSALAWVVNAYLIAFGGLLLLAGRLGDLIGRRRVFLAGLTVFTLASLACGLADTRSTLIAARFAQGVGGALTSAVILGMIVTMFQKPAERAQALGVYSFVAAAGGAIGLLAGGVLTQAINWHWIFFVNIPIGIATAVLTLRLLPNDTGIGLEQGADAPGALLIVAALMLVVYAIVETGTYGWGSARTLIVGGAGLVLLVAFVARQALAAHPLVPLRVFASRTVSVANLMFGLVVAGVFGMFFVGALYLQRVLNYDAIEVGLAFLPVALGIAALALGLAARLIVRFGAKPTLIAGLILVVAGLILFRRAPANADYVADLLPAMASIGVGAGLLFPSVVTLAMSAATPEDSGLASGLVNTTRQVGGVIGTAILATLATAHSNVLRAHGASNQAALLGGYRLAFTIAAALVLAATAIGLVMLPASGGVKASGPVGVRGRKHEPALLEEAA